MRMTTTHHDPTAAPRVRRVACAAPRPRRAVLALAGAVVFAASLAAAGGCRGDRSGEPPRQFFPDMDDQPKVKAQDKSTFYTEFEAEEYGNDDWGRASRLPVAGTVPFGRWPVAQPDIMGVDFAERDDFLRQNPAIYEAVDEQGDVVVDIPVAVTPELLALGQKQYNIYCITCHGGSGAGDGMVGVRWTAPVPSYHEDRYQKGARDDEGELLLTGLDGHLYDVIRNGVANPPGVEPALRMPAYSDKVSPREAWAIVAYIRALQMTRQGELDMLDAAERQRLRAQLPAGHPYKSDDAGAAGVRTANAGGTSQ
jgi:mono/diheme cytochrome c family protein